MDNICIEKATDEYIEYISNNVESKFTCSWTKEQFASIVKIGNTHCFVAKCNDTILGFICFKKIVDEIDILNIAVDIDCRGKGIGYALMQSVISFAKENNLSPINLEVNVNNKQAIQLYTKVGFRIIYTRKGYYFNKLTNNNEDAYIMIFEEEYIC